MLSARRERLDRIIFFGMDHLRHALQEYVAHYNEERPHQGLGNELVSGAAPATGTGRVTKNERLGGLLNSYRRAA